MPTYLVSYDLRKVRNYDNLINELRTSRFISPLKSVWLGVSTHNSETIRDILRRHMDADDGIMVLEIKPTSNWATFNLDGNDQALDFIRRNIGP